MKKKLKSSLPYTATRSDLALRKKRAKKKKHTSFLPSTSPPPVTIEMIEQSFRGTFEPVRETWGYRIGLFLTACVMVLLFVFYIALVGAVGWSVYQFAVYYKDMPTTNVLGVFVYLSLLVAGGFFFVFMVRPFFARYDNSETTRALSPDEEPLLFALVEQLCLTLRSPVPERIEIDLNVNASARFLPGLRSFLQHKLTLRIGLPLVAGLSMRHFTGVLAHEFGHFAQGAGMRLGYLIRTINLWFMRAVFERSALDDRLRDLSESSGIWFGWGFYLARFFIWITRKILWLFMALGELISSYMNRQMEYDADRYQARIIGSDQIGPLLRNVTHLEVASFLADADLHDAWRDGRLGDDFPALVVARLDKIDDEIAKNIDENIENTKTGFFDSHPSHPDRARNAAAEACPGLFRLSIPTTVLFRDFDETSKRQTLSFYRDLFDDNFQEDSLIPTPILLARMDALDKERKAFQRSFQGIFLPIRPPSLEPIGPPPDDLQLATTEIERLSEDFLEQLPEAHDAFLAYQRNESVYNEQDITVRLIECQLINNRDLKIYEELDHHRKLRDATHQEQQALLDTINQSIQRAFQRIHLALQLLGHPQIEQKLEDATACRTEAKQLIETWNFLQELAPQLTLLRENFFRSVGYLHASEEVAAVTNSQTEVQQSLQSLFQEILDLHARLEHEPYPFDHAKGDVDLASYAMPELPESTDDLPLLIGSAEMILDRMLSLYARILGRLSLFTEAVEESLDLEPLPDPDLDALEPSHPDNVSPEHVTSTR